MVWFRAERHTEKSDLPFLLHRKLQNTTIFQYANEIREL